MPKFLRESLSPVAASAVPSCDYSRPSARALVNSGAVAECRRTTMRQVSEVALQIPERMIVFGQELLILRQQNI